MPLETLVYSNRLIISFMDNIREKDADLTIRDLCLLGIHLFKDRNPNLPHFSYGDVHRCLENFIEESKL